MYCVCAYTGNVRIELHNYYDCCSLSPLQRGIIMSDDIVEGEEGDAPVISERVQVTNSIHTVSYDTLI